MNTATLSVPAEVAEDVEAAEILRVWENRNGLHCSLQLSLGYHEEKMGAAKAWGLILAEIALRVATILSSAQGGSRKEAIERVLKLFKTEMEHSTGNVRGGFIND